MTTDAPAGSSARRSRAARRARSRRSRGARAAVVIAAFVVAGAATGAVLGASSLAASPGTETSAPAPRVTATAVPPVAADVPTTALAAEPGPRVSVSPTIDLDAHSIDDPASPWVVVNKARALQPEDFAPAELSSEAGGLLVPEAAAAMVRMRAAAADDGAPFMVGSGYRSHASQASLHREYVGRWGAARADRFSARAGHSEHQTGWAADVQSSAACELKECFADEPAGRWLAEHAHEHGFIVRYPEGAEGVTGYRHEPWHLRYVGVELATAMREQGVATLEQMLGLDPAPTYAG